MYTRWIPFLNKKNIILASSSPRRKEILSELGIHFEIHKSEFEENISKEDISPSKYVEETCNGKFEYYLKNQRNYPCDILITADSIIEFNNKILEKPKDKNQLKEWLNLYSENKIIVHTYMVIGIIDTKFNCIKKEQFITSTNVIFDKISEDEINDYINTNDPYDKAGGFGIQASAKVFIKGIEGDFYNVVGFPVNAFIKHLNKLLCDVYGKNAYTQY